MQFLKVMSARMFGWGLCTDPRSADPQGIGPRGTDPEILGVFAFFEPIFPIFSGISLTIQRLSDNSLKSSAFRRDPGCHQ